MSDTAQFPHPCAGSLAHAPGPVTLLGLLREIGPAAAAGGWTEPARAELAEMLRVARDTGWVPPPTADDLKGALDDPALRAWVAERERPHPFGTDTEPYPDTGGRRHAIRHTYLRCVGDGEPEELSVTALRDDPRWDFRELPLNHLGLLYAPDVVAEALLGLAEGGQG